MLSRLPKGVLLPRQIQPHPMVKKVEEIWVIEWKEKNICFNKTSVSQAFLFKSI
jgi:hypothetical protein